MSAATSIEWTDATWNPVTGCTEVSPGCDHCYAKTFAERFRGGPGHHFEHGFDVQLREDKLSLPLRWRKPRKVFVNSMSDLFHDFVPDDYIARVFAVMAGARQHTFQLLTKRHGRMHSLLNSQRFVDKVRVYYSWADDDPSVIDYENDQRPAFSVWPLPNVWLGVSVENQQWANIRIPALLDTPAAVRWLSCEPLLGPVDLDGPVINGHRPKLTYWLTGRPDWGQEHTGPTGVVMQDLVTGPRIDWVVVGGESGRGARPMDPEWAHRLRDQCQAANVPFLFKQWGEWAPRCTLALCGRRCSCAGANASHPTEMHRVGKKAAGRLLGGLTYDEYPERAA
jgi:protein gp37